MAVRTKLSSNFHKLIDSVDRKIDVLNAKAAANYDVIIQEFIGRVKINLQENKSNASGRLTQSITPLTVISDSNILRVAIEIEDYWRDVEFGQKPGLPKNNPRSLYPKILDWYDNKPSAQRFAKRINVTRETLSYIVARKVFLNGTEPRPFLMKEMDKFKKDLLEELQQQITR
jgi:hypothetical protein